MLSHSAGRRLDATETVALPQIKRGVSRVEASALDRRKGANRPKLRVAPPELSGRFRDFSLTVGGSPVTSSA